MSTKGIEAGRAFVRVDADQSALDKKLKQIEAKFKNLGKGIGNFGKGVTAIGAGFSAIGATILAPITAAVHKFTAAGDALDKMSARTGVGVEALQEIGFAAEQGGTDIEQVEKGFNKLSQTVYDAGRGLSTATAALGEIGLSYDKLKSLKPEDQFQAVADGLSAIADESKRGAVAQAIFGRGGRQLLPMLSSLREIRQEARDLGLVLSKDDTDAAAKLADAFNRIKRTIGGAFLQVGAAVAEPVLKALNVITQITASINKWVQANRALVQQIAAIGVGFLAVGSVVTALGVSIVGVGFTISAIGTIIGSITTVASAAFAGVTAAIGAILSPIGLATVAVVGLGGYITYAALESTGSLGKLSEMFGSLGETATTAWGGIVAAISSGDLETAGQIAFTALEVGWLTVTTTMQTVWSRVSDFFVNVWLNAVQSIVQIGANNYFGIAGYFDKLSVALMNGFDTAAVYITGAIDGIQTAIAKAFIKAQEFFGLFSKEQSQQIQSSLDSELAQRAQGRDQGLGKRSGQRAADVSVRDSQRQNTAKQFADTVAEDLQRRQRVTPVDGGGLSAAQQRLADLQAKLQEQSSGAVAKVAAAQAGSDKAAQAGQAQESAALAIQATGSGSVGSFVSGVAGQIAGGGSSALEDLGKEQVDLLNSIDERLRTSSEEGVLV